MKLLNLTADWLDALLPHALSRIDRVHYGLLQPEELERAYTRNPAMPRNRALLAVSAAAPPTRPRHRPPTPPPLHPTAPPPHPTAPQPRSPAAPLPRCPANLLPRCPAAPLPLDMRRGRRHHPRALTSPC